MCFEIQIKKTSVTRHTYALLSGTFIVTKIKMKQRLVYYKNGSSSEKEKNNSLDSMSGFYARK